MLKKNLNYVSYFIILTFTASVFFWSIEIYKIQFRFLYLLSIFFFLKITLKKETSIFIIFIVVHSFLINYFLNIGFDLKFYLEISILIVLTYLVEKNFHLIISNIDNILKYFSFLFIILLLISIFFFPVSNLFDDFPTCTLGCFSIKKYIFKENSHYAITVLPVIFYLSLIKKNNLFLFIKYFLLLVGLFNFSTTLFVGIILISIIFFIFDWNNSQSFQKKNFFYLIIFSLLLMLLNSQVIKNRLISFLNVEVFNIYSIKKDTSNDEDFTNNLNERLPANLSTDVFVKSFKISILSFLKYPLGVGLNNYSFSHDNFINYVETKYILTKILNIQDGANNFNKILAEFGIFSLFFGYLMFKFFFNKKIRIELKYFFISFILLQTFIRGVGYYNGGFLIIFLIILFNLYKTKKISD